LQGRGAHRAFTWGVLDRLLDEPWLRIEGISGTSAGAMNAAVLGGSTTLSAVGGVWAVVVVALAAAVAVTVALNYRRLQSLRASLDAGANASVLPALSVASLVGFGAVIAALPAFARDFVLSIEGSPLVSLAFAVNV
jgi:H+/gluconate symporter-like permease